MRKFILSIILVVLCAVSAIAQIKTEKLALTGIVNLPDFKAAIIEAINVYFTRTENYICREGQKMDGIEVRKIDAGTRIVKLDVNGNDIDLRLKSNDDPGTKSSIQLTSAPMNAILDLYSMFVGKTLLRGPLPPDTFTLSANPSDQAEAASVIANTLYEHQIVVVANGDKFLKLIPNSWRDTMNRRAEQLRTAQTNPVQSEVSPNAPEKAEVDVNFPGVALDQVGEFYRLLVGAKRGEPDTDFWNAGSRQIYFKTANPLTKSEALYALNTLISWEGLRVERTPGGMIKLVGLDPAEVLELKNANLSTLLNLYSEITGRTILQPMLSTASFNLKVPIKNPKAAESVITNALKRYHIAATLDGDKFVRIVPDRQLQADMERAAKLKAAPAKFPQIKFATIESASVDISFPGSATMQVADFYSLLVGSKGVENDPALLPIPASLFTLKTVTPLTKAEALYALDTLFAWNGLEVLPGSNNLIRLAVIHQQTKTPAAAK